MGPRLSDPIAWWCAGRVLLASLLLQLAGTAAAADTVWAPTTDRLTSAEGLPSQSIYSVVRDPQGFLWFGSDRGAIRYDGRRVRVLNASDASQPRLSSDAASHVFVDRAGTLWIGSWGGGLDRVDLQRGAVRNWRHDPADPDSMASDHVQVLFEARDGTLWIGTGGGLMRFDRDADRPRRALTSDEAANELGRLRIWSIAEAADGRLWLGTDSGLLRYDPVNGVAETQRISGRRSRAEVVRLVFVDRRDRLWLALENGFGRFDPATGTVDEVELPIDLGGGLILNTALPAADGRYWLGSWSGVWLLDTELGELVDIGQSGLKQWFPADDVRGLYHDRSGLLWAATRYNGVARIELEAPRLRLYRNELAGLGSGMGSEVVRAVYRGAGRVWLNTDGAMLEVDLDRARFEPIEATRGLRVGRFGPSAFDDAGRALVATVFGPARVDLGSMRIEPVEGLLEAAGVRDPNLGFVLRDSRDRLWWSTQREGVVVSDLDGALLQYHPPGPGEPGQMADSAASCALEDSRGRVWLCAAIGLSRWDDDRRRFEVYRHRADDQASLSHPRVNTLLEDSDGRIWAGTAAGLDRFDEASGRFVRHAPEDSPISVAALLESEPGVLWVASGGRLWQFDSRAGRFVGAPIDVGERGLLFSDNAALRLDRRRLLFGTNRGLLLFDPARPATAGEAPPVAITAVNVDGRPLLPDTGDDGSRRIELGPRQRVLEIEFAALDFRAPAQHRHAYRLEGFDQDWVEAGAQTTAKYTNLAPGQYRFHAIAAGADQVWNEQGVTLAIDVIPPWWRDWRLQLLSAALMILAGIAALRVYAGRIRRREQALKQLVDERARVIAEQQSQLAVQEKMASLGTLTAGVAHEINNPTNFTHVGAQNLQAAIADFRRVLIELAGDDADSEVLALFEQRFGRIGEQLDAICEGTERIRTIVGHLRSFARLDDAASSRLRVDDGLRATLALVRTQFRDAVHFELDLASTADINGWPAQLNQVHMNLLVNACQAVVERHGRDPSRGQVQVTSRDHVDEVCIEIRDNGHGIRSEHLSRVFEPFFTTKGIGEGTGMGLAIAYGIVERHGGRLEAASVHGDGACMRIWLPRAATHGERSGADRGASDPVATDSAPG